MIIIMSISFLIIWLGWSLTIIFAYIITYRGMALKTWDKVTARQRMRTQIKINYFNSIVKATALAFATWSGFWLIYFVIIGILNTKF